MKEFQKDLPESSGELSSEEILERAKKENENLGDERQRGRMAWGNYAGFIATILSAVIVLIVKTFLRGSIPNEIFAIFASGIAAQNIAQACVCTKKFRTLYIVTSVLITAGAVLYWVMWILELCGVVL